MKNWDLYWKTNQSLGTFGTAEGVLGIPTSLANHWRQVFHRYTDAGEIRMLDVGTGNGVLPFIACSQLNNLNDIVAIDLANIDPLNTITDSQITQVLQSVKFLGNTSIENTQLPANSFNLITSNFAIEYADLEIALPEVWRLLTPGGEFYAVMHSPDSVSYQDSITGLKVIDNLLNEMQIFNALESMFSEPVSVSQALRKKLFSSLTQYRGSISGSEEVLWLEQQLVKIADICICHQKSDFATGKQKLALYKNHTLALFERLTQQIKASRPRPELEKLLGSIANDEYQLQPLSLEQESVATLLVISKPK
ncbi:class I SAM-dependent methyltransferase [Thalassotalea mangrovi]|uniref:Class I SAM-dependent methyltransferase n=1 Tax=Thalassotalea mangrovi TaxID=2572245 RepID=A0A4U1B3T5_9GAMM|nr:methyltransferase domain-containing protein [Thalassotalea mangrovi]TKB44679.1 class I SAM-dependent methyltransferase [Thalassotalea mangrovi]